MMDKYARLGNEYREAISELASATGWQEEQAGKVLAVILDASERKMRAVSEQRKAERKFEKLEATRNLLKNYRRLKISIECGAEHTLKLLEDREYQRLMELEESVQNQRLVSTALLTAGNRVLWTRLNAALDCFKEFCASDPSPRVQRQYRLVYERYMAVPEKPVKDVLELLGIERTRYRGMNAAMLWAMGLERQYHDPRWCTFKQTQDKDWHIKKGEKGTPIEFWSIYDTKERRKLTLREAEEIVREDPDREEEALQQRVCGVQRYANRRYPRVAPGPSCGSRVHQYVVGKLCGNLSE